MLLPTRLFPNLSPTLPPILSAKLPSELFIFTSSIAPSTGHRQGSRLWRAAMVPVLASCLALAGCGGGSDSTPAPTDNQSPGTEDEDSGDDGLGQDETPDPGVVGEVGELSGPTEDVPADLVAELAADDQIGLIIDSTARCAIVGQSFDMAITRSLSVEEENAGVLEGPQDVSAYVTLTQSLGDSLELLSRGDGAIQFRHRQQDMVGLTAELGTGSVTAYLAGFASDAPASVVLKKPVIGGCLYALRLPGYCATGFAKSGTLSIGIGDQAISAQGCELDNPANHLVVELAAPE